jgi:hypothetical protein
VQQRKIKFHNVCEILKSSTFCFYGATTSSGPGAPHYRGFTITLRHTTLGRTPLDKWSARRRDLYPAIHNTHKREISKRPEGFEPTIRASERPPTRALDRAATRLSKEQYLVNRSYQWIELCLFTVSAAVVCGSQQNLRVMSVRTFCQLSGSHAGAQRPCEKAWFSFLIDSDTKPRPPLLKVRKTAALSWERGQLRIC